MPGLLRADLNQGRLRTEKWLELRNQIDQHLTQIADGLQDVGFELQALPRIPGLQLPAEFRQRLPKREIGDVLLVLVELAADEEAVPVPGRHPELLHQRRLSHPGGPGNQQDFALSGADALE